MKIAALTLWQPYATLVSLRLKANETRSWQISYRGLLAIHAAKAYTKEMRAMADSEPFRSALRPDGVYAYPELTLGCVIAVVELVNCKLITPDNIPPEPERNFGDYRPGRFMWVLRNVQRIATAVPARGKQGLWVWEVPEDIRFVD